jgi:hypothetical protein
MITCSATRAPSNMERIACSMMGEVTVPPPRPTAPDAMPADVHASRRAPAQSNRSRDSSHSELTAKVCGWWSGSLDVAQASRKRTDPTSPRHPFETEMSTSSSPYAA